MLIGENAGGQRDSVHENRFLVQMGVDVAPDHDVANDDVSLRNFVEHLAGGVGPAWRGRCGSINWGRR